MSITGSEQWMYSSGAAGFYDFPIEQSLRFEDGDSAYLSRTPASAGNRKTWTWSGWVKRGNLGGFQYLFSAGNTTPWAGIIFSDNATNSRIQVSFTAGSSTGTATSAEFRDVSSWYHIVLAVDTTQATAANRIKLYVNGNQITEFASTNYPALNFDTQINNNILHTFGRQPTASSAYFDGYLAEVNFIDGQALDPTSFGEVKSGIWIPKDTAGLTFGSNGFRLQFGDGAAIGDDTSGNTNDFTANNLVASDVVPDSPTNNFATMNPNDFALYLSEGNLKVSNSTGSGSIIARSTMLVPPNSGKWYFEGYNTVTSANGHYIGVWCPTGLNAAISSGYHDDSNFGVLSGHECVTYLSNGTIRNNSSSSTVTGLDDFNTSGDIVGVLLDMDAQTVQFYNNGSAQGSAQSLPNTTDPYGFFVAGHFSKGVIFNFGQDSTFAGLIAAGGNPDANGLGDFKYAPPSGALSPCSANLPQGAIDTLNDETPEDYFNTVLWTGDNTTGGRSVTGVGFQPDLVYAKSRSAAYSPLLYDSIRGTGATAELKSDGTEAEGGSSSSERGYLNSFDSDGFSSVVGTNGDNLYFNQLSETYVAWNWKAGGAGVSNTDGSITSTVSVGATSQQNWFSIVSYTGNNTDGATVGHGLGVVPSLIITKSRSATSLTGWMTKHKDLASNYNVALNKTDAAWNPSSNGWVGDLTSDTTFSLENGTVNGNNANQSGVTYIAYCFANAEGLCKVGSYVGNGSSDGPMIWAGHRPAFLLIKRTGSAGPWLLWDNKRTGFNGDNDALRPNDSAVEYNGSTYKWVDLLSNGFKIIDNSADFNNSGETFIYLSIAEQPFAFANAR